MKSIYLVRYSLVFLAALLASFASFAGGDDDPLLAKVMIDELERGLDSDDPININAKAWIGKDINKLWLKAEGGYQDSHEQALEVQARYSRAIAPYWDAQIGLRADIEPSPSRKWLVVGVQGLAPYFFDISADLFVGDKGRTAMRLSAEYELMLTQKLIFSPELGMNLYGKEDAALGIGSGLADISSGIRLRYEIIRELAPYIGIEHSRQFGNTADYTRDAGAKTNETQLVVGLKVWF